MTATQTSPRRPSREVLFPSRQRCKKCGKGLGLRAQDPVFDGLFCSAKCAGVAAPATRPEDAPRECVTTRDDTVVFKRKYRSEGEIPGPLREDPTTNWYRCSHCHHLHIGHTRIDLKSEPTRGLRERSDMADLLVKARGGATLKQVAEVIEVRPIRIKEWEDPAFDAPSLVVLFKLLAVYRLKLAAVFPQARRS
jgi:hypothetical protein